jgi:hypothetical protein
MTTFTIFNTYVLDFAKELHTDVHSRNQTHLRLQIQTQTAYHSRPFSNCRSPWNVKGQ